MSWGLREFGEDGRRGVELCFLGIEVKFGVPMGPSVPHDSRKVDKENRKHSVFSLCSWKTSQQCRPQHSQLMSPREEGKMEERNNGRRDKEKGGKRSKK